LSIIDQGRKTSNFCIGVMVLEKCQNTVASRGLLHLWSDIGKIKISPILVGQMTSWMSQMIVRHKDISNELS